MFCNKKGYFSTSKGTLDRRSIGVHAANFCSVDCFLAVTSAFRFFFHDRSSFCSAAFFFPQIQSTVSCLTPAWKQMFAVAGAQQQFKQVFFIDSGFSGTWKFGTTSGKFLGKQKSFKMVINQNTFLFHAESKRSATFWINCSAKSQRCPQGCGLYPRVVTEIWKTSKSSPAQPVPCTVIFMALGFSSEGFCIRALATTYRT